MLTLLDFYNNVHSYPASYNIITAVLQERKLAISLHLWPCNMHTADFQDLCHVVMFTFSVCCWIFFRQSFILISTSILSVTNPCTSHFVNISWCPSDAFHSHSVAIHSSLRYSVSACVGVWGPVLFSTLFGTSAYGKRSWQLTYGSFNYSSDLRACLSPNIRHCRHHNQHSHFLPHY